MATLNSTNVQTGNTVESNDILQLYDAFTSGGGTTGAYSVSISGSLTGLATSASFAVSASRSVSSSFAQTASFVLSSSYALSASFAQTASFALSASYALSASFASTASFVLSSSYALSSSFASTASFVASSSYALSASNAQTASFALSSSYALSASNAQTASFVVSSSYAVTASYAITASYALNAGITQWYSPTTNGYSTPSGRDVGILFKYVSTNPAIYLHTSSAQPGDQVIIIVSSSQNYNVTVNVGSPAKIALGSTEGTSIVNGADDSYWKYICVDARPTWRLVGYSDTDTIAFGVWALTLT